MISHKTPLPARDGWLAALFVSFAAASAAFADNAYNFIYAAPRWKFSLVMRIK